MINLVIAHLVTQLNDFMNVRAPAPPDRVFAGPLFALDGNPNAEAQDKVVLTITNVEEDRVYKPVDRFHQRDDGTTEITSPELNLNLYLLVIANLTAYDEALKAISNVAAFFQQKNVFHWSDIPGSTSDERGRIALEMVSLNFEQINHLWGALGAKYMPSVMYKIGLVVLRDTDMDAEAPPVERILINE